MNLLGKTGLCIAAGLLLFGAGMWTGMRQHQPAKTEPAAPAHRQQDGSLVLERDPRGTVETPQLPPGATLERAVSVVVQTHGASDAVTPLTYGTPQQDGLTPSRAIAQRVRINLALVRMSDNTMRVIASSPDGEVVGGLDVPVQNRAPSTAPKWSASVLYGPKGRLGGLVQRSIGPVTVGIGAFGGNAWVQAGFSW